MPTLLFVYGDLVQGRPQDGWLAGRPRRPATARGRLYRLPGGAPGLLPDPDGPDIRGEIVTLDSPAELGVVDYVLGAADGALLRQRLAVRVGRHTVEAEAHVLTPVQAARLVPLRARDWRRVGGRGG